MGKQYLSLEKHAIKKVPNSELCFPKVSIQMEFHGQVNKFMSLGIKIFFLIFFICWKFAASEQFVCICKHTLRSNIRVVLIIWKIVEFSIHKSSKSTFGSIKCT